MEGESLVSTALTIRWIRAEKVSISKILANNSRTSIYQVSGCFGQKTRGGRRMEQGACYYQAIPMAEDAMERDLITKSSTILHS